MPFSTTLQPEGRLASLARRKRERHAARLLSPRGRGYTSRVPVQSREIRAERERIRAIAAELRSADQVSPRGIALVERLLVDGASPLYAPSAPGELEATLRHATAALSLA